MAVYNNPALGQAFENLASAFAPPSGSDLAGYARASAEREDAARRAALFEAAGSENFNQPVFDRQAIAAGLYNPTQGFYAQDQNNATQRYGYDTQASTSRANNAADNDRALTAAIISAATAPVSQGAIRPGFDPSVYGVNAPAVPEFAGSVAPLSETQWQAGQNQRLLDSGQLTDEMMLDTIMGERTPVQVIGPNGTPQYASPGAAVRTGAEPFIKSTGSTETQNYQTPDGARGTAFFDNASNVWKDTATQQPIPQGAITFNSSLQGGAQDTGLGPTTANTTQGNELEATLNGIDADADYMIDLLKKNPGVAGMPGDIRGVAQNVVSVLGEMTAAFGDLPPDAPISMADISGAVSQVAPSRDPAIQTYRTSVANLAYKIAKAGNPSGEVSRQAYERALASLEGGTFGNNQSALEALQATKAYAQRQRDSYLRTLRNPGQPDPLQGTTTAPATPPAAPAAPAAPVSSYPVGTIIRNPTTNARLRWNGANWEPVE